MKTKRARIGAPVNTVQDTPNKTIVNTVPYSRGSSSLVDGKLVWTVPTEEYDWPVYKSDYERIWRTTQSMKHLSIAEAFEKTYGMELSQSVKESTFVNNIAVKPEIGTIIDLFITHIGKDGVIFDSGNYKYNITTKNNLYKYEKFKHFIPSDAVPCKVIEVKRDNMVVDVMGALLDRCVISRAHNQVTQNKMDRAQISPVTVRNLQLVKGGYIGDLVLDEISDWIGEDFTCKCFVPGSHVDLNIISDFESVVGTDVQAFISGVSDRFDKNSPSVICSVKNYKKHLGDLNLIDIYNMWCDDDVAWKEFSTRTWVGKVTGVINSAKKCGVFIEIPDLNLTGMISAPADELVNYTRGSEYAVSITGIEENIKYNPTTSAIEHDVPYVIENDCLRNIYIKPIFTLA